MTFIFLVIMKIYPGLARKLLKCNIFRRCYAGCYGLSITEATPRSIIVFVLNSYLMFCHLWSGRGTIERIGLMKMNSNVITILEPLL